MCLNLQALLPSTMFLPKMKSKEESWPPARLLDLPLVLNSLSYSFLSENVQMVLKIDY